MVASLLGKAKSIEAPLGDGSKKVTSKEKRPKASVPPIVARAALGMRLRSYP